MEVSGCGHKSFLGCELTAVPTCCACADKRPLSSAYPTYVDGQGMRMRGSRSDRYCWRCRDYWAALSAQTQRTLPCTRFLSSNDNEDLGIANPLAEARDTSIHETEYQPSIETRPLHADPSWSFGPTEMPLPNSAHLEDTATQDHPSTMTSTVEAEHTREARASRRRNRRNPFGTREEWNAENYQSPISGMFTRAWDRYRTMESLRREAEVQGQVELSRIQDDIISSGTSRSTNSPPRVTMPYRPSPNLGHQRTPADEVYSHRAQNAWPTLGQARPGLSTHVSNGHGLTHSHESWYEQGAPHRDVIGQREEHPDLRTIQVELRAAELVEAMLSETPTPTPADVEAARARSSRLINRHAQLLRNASQFDEEEETLPNPIDEQTQRPTALSFEEMKVNIACHICAEQKSDTLLLPCSHLSICRWCVAILRDRARSERRENPHLPRTVGQGWQCPMCRSAVLATKKVFLG